ncbi:TPA: hypothetical protein ACIZCU_001413 [Legionella pneumophila]|jgi:hypothetical protein
MKNTRIVAIIFALLTLICFSSILGACHTTPQNSETTQDGYGGGGHGGGHGGHGGGGH